MKIRWKIAALAGVLLVGLLAVIPTLVTAPVAEEDFEECADNDVCFIVLLTNEEVSLSDPDPLFGPGAPGFDTWLYVENPSDNIERSLATGGDGEDNVVVESLVITITDPTGAEFAFTLIAGEPPFADRWDPVVHASETSRVFFVGFAGFIEADIGEFVFEYELALTFRGESFSLSVDFEIEIVE